MKKKLSCLLAAALLLAGLAGCGEKQQTATESYIAPAVLTDGDSLSYLSADGRQVDSADRGWRPL